MSSFYVNGNIVKCEGSMSLLRYLRDELRLTSVKDGCSEGACGTCTVIIDGRAMKACVQRTDRLGGKHIITTEGLSEFEKEAYVYAFGHAGAVQCGFCTPGMVMAAKALLDKVSDPSEDEIRRALRGNICRCTGYVKIVDAVRLAARLLRDGTIPESGESWAVGSRVPRLDVREKVLGYGEYTDDMYIDGMAYASALRAEYPRARILKIDTEKAKAADGIIAVFTAKDIPGQNKVGHLKKDWDTMIAEGDCTRYLGDAVALVVGETAEAVEAAKALISVDYEELTPIRNAYEAMAEDAPMLHEGGNLLAHKHVSRGDAAGAIAKSKHILHGKYTTCLLYTS